MAPPTRLLPHPVLPRGARCHPKDQEFIGAFGHKSSPCATNGNPEICLSTMGKKQIQVRVSQEHRHVQQGAAWLVTWSTNEAINATVSCELLYLHEDHTFKRPTDAVQDWVVHGLYRPIPNGRTVLYSNQSSIFTTDSFDALVHDCISHAN